MTTSTRIGRATGRAAIVAAAAAVALAAGGQARAATSSTAVSSSNWSGYAVGVAGQTFSDVKGSWIQPAVSCTATGASYASFWVGLGGFAAGQGGLEQIGTFAGCQDGQPTYDAWYELIPAPSVAIQLTIAPHDRISAEVSVAGTAVTLSLTDLTSGQTFSTTQTVGVPDVSSAEWIAEAPSQCGTAVGSTCETLSLASFGTATFTAASATADAHTGTISDLAWTATGIQLVPIVAGSASSTPSVLSPDGSSFTVTTIVPTARSATAATSSAHRRRSGLGRWDRHRRGPH